MLTLLTFKIEVDNLKFTLVQRLSLKLRYIGYKVLAHCLGGLPAGACIA